jgi:hypothetical protein
MRDNHHRFVWRVVTRVVGKAKRLDDDEDDNNDDDDDDDDDGDDDDDNTELPMPEGYDMLIGSLDDAKRDRNISRANTFLDPYTMSGLHEVDNVSSYNYIMMQ